MDEILTGLWNAFAPFVGKAIIAIIVVSAILVIATLIIRRRKP